MFVDEVELEARGGDGGDGAVSFRRERFVPRGGPDGGDGGRGGSVYAEADARLRTLNHLAGVEVAAAGRGVDGAGRKRTGAAGKDRVLSVPLGTEIGDAEGEVVGEIVRAGERVVLVRGGRGGRGNVHFASATMQVPRYAEKGQPGERRRLRFTLKIIAEVALVGPPNAGKSSLLAAISSARPKIAAYPFTTLAPQLGLVETATEALAVVEVPGLLEGASAGRGLGHEFLRHVERARALVIVIDGAGGAAARDLAAVREELARYNADLPRRIRLVVVNKIDLPGAAEVAAELSGPAGSEVAATSAVTGEGLREFKRRVLEIAATHDDSRS
ncbi:MAG: GTPase ObgE [Candidatus Coatesbacteria bacterium]|nr:MAG: GTPase ObgE [Candidatus Coatesbacteria bacterium]